MKLKKFLPRFLGILACFYVLLLQLDKAFTNGIVLVIGVFFLLFFISSNVGIKEWKIEIIDKENHQS